MDHEDYPDTWGKDKKNTEYRSLNAATANLDFLKSLTDTSSPNQEKPDFVFTNEANTRIGIEHFCVDISMGSRKNSGTKKSQSALRDIYERYHGNIINQESGALSDIENMLNRLVMDWQKFDCHTFCDNFKRVFNEHYSKIEEYKTNSNLTSIGFLIEFLVPNPTYKISIKGEPLHIQELHDFPITTEMWEIMNESFRKLDFIILDTNHFARKKDSIVLVNKETTPRIVSEFAPLLKGENGKVKLRLIN